MFLNLKKNGNFKIGKIPLHILQIHSAFAVEYIFASKNRVTELVFEIWIYMLFAGWEGRIVKNCDRGLENAARGHRPRAAFSSPRSQFFTIRTDPKPANNLFIFFLR